MENNKQIKQKLKQFVSKYYTNELLKGILLFFSIGLLYFIFTLLIEHFLWLQPSFRTLLFWVFIAVEIGLLYKLILVPLFYLVGFKKGITTTESATIIGNHFPEVQDKLLNLLQLENTETESELVLASINQKANELSPIPFKKAINYKKNKKYLKYAIIPILIFLGFQFTGNQEVIQKSYKRVMNHDVAYTPPAPFYFIIQNKKLQAIENENFTVNITTQGKVLPTDIKINFNEESYYLTKTAFNSYQYQFQNVQKDIEFTISANNIVSKKYDIQVLKVPTITDFKMFLDYPAYTGTKDAHILNTGNITIPEGTLVYWNLKTKTTSQIDFISKDSISQFSKNNSLFTYAKRIYKGTPYQIATSNENLKKHEKLNYNIQVVKDEFPEIAMQSKPDSLDHQIIYFLGKITDDYGFKKLQLVYNQIDSDKKNTVSIPLQKTNYQQFTYSFPGNLILEKGKAYAYYFEIFDNDVIHHYKKATSERFTYHKLTDEALAAQKLQEQEQNINNLSKSLQKLNDQEKELQEINKLQKEKKELSWMDKLKVKNLFKKEEKQNQMMQKFNKDLQRNLEEFQKDKQDDSFKEQLKERLQDQEKELEKNEKLLEELKALKEKISEEELFDKIEKLSKNQQQKEKSLEQVLELTKRYYVKKKFEKLVDDLAKLAQKQEKLANQPDAKNTKEKQDALNEEFNKLQKEMEDIKKDNDDLKKPMQLDDKKESQNSIKKEQQEASDNLEKKNKKKAKKKQKEAAKKMKEMSMKMRQQQSSSSEEEMEEDIKMLRQILDNLIHYSFDQEHLMNEIKDLNANFSMPDKLRKQNLLKNHFKHIDDSLFALSLRQPKISEMITKEVTDVHFNINKSLERFADVKNYLGITNQQYALTAANNLANFLSSVLNSMENAMKQPGSGSCDKPGGTGDSFSLPDIIEIQEELLGKMKDGQQKGDQGKPKDGDGKPKPGEGSKPGQDGKPSQKGEGKDGKSGDPTDKKGKGDKLGENSDENSAQELYEIYKQQQQLKQQLKDMLQQKGLQAKDNNLIKQMDALENKLLEQGFNDNVVKQMEQIKNEMLKMMKAAYKQGEDNKREATTNNTSFTNKTNAKKPNITQYFNEVEILNRHALPLQPIYKHKVQQYFKKNND